jgi:hypothetical protein
MNKEFPIEAGTPVLVRNRYYDKWRIDAFESISYNKLPAFRGSAGWWGMMAPYDGNRNAIMTDKDVFDLWDYSRLKEEGFVK